mmetsp:Transcript_37555/g.6755  ORF Transcript_37555/g.6755 Transcript_37555/m.6755 type:complete len:80 (-) Transcript_37555:580-819(-)
MTSARGIFAWNINIKKQNGCLVFDKGSESIADQIIVNENAMEHIVEEMEANPNGINSQRRLNNEARNVSNKFLNAALLK